MRASRLVWLAGGVFFLLAQSCTKKDDATGEGPETDAAALPGEGGTTADDGATVTPDGSTTGPVSVVVKDRAGAPLAGVTIAFVETSGAAAVETTGADGAATHALAAGGTVIVAEAAPGLRRLTTIFSVEPSDVLAVTGGAATSPVTPPTFGTLHFTGAATYVTGVTHDIYIGCTSTSISGASVADLPVPETCVHGGAVDMLGVARDGAGGPVAFFTKHVPLTKDATANVDIQTGDWTAAVDKTFGLTGTAPSQLQNVSVQFDFLKNGLLYLDTAGAASAPYDAVAVPSPPAGFADAFQSLTLLELGDATDAGGALQSVSLLFSQGAPPSGPTLTHAFADFLPRLHSPVIGGSVAAPQIGWSQDGPTNAAVGGFVSLGGNITTDAGLATLEWIAVFPPGAPSVALPTLPPALAGFTPTEPLGISSLGLVASPQLGSYKAFRKNAAPFDALVFSVTADAPPGAIDVALSGIRQLID